MLEIVLTYPTDEGTGEIFLDGEKVSFGRGSDAEYRFEDDGLSRLHASIYREDDYIWIVDENSSNGTFVNGEKVGASGTPLEDGDTIKIGHYTNIKVKIREKEEVSESSSNQTDSNTQTVSTANAGEQKSSMLIPLAITAFALLLIGASVVFISFTVMGSGGTETAHNDPTEIEDDPDFPTRKKNLDKDKDAEKSSNAQTDGTSTSDPTGNDQTTTTTIDENADITDSPTATKDGRTLSIPSGKNYQNMSEEEKNAYVKAKAEKVARIIGNNSTESIPPDAVAQIRQWLDGYVRRIRGNRTNDCSMRGWLSSDTVSIMERAKENAPFIVKEFNKQDVSPYVGVYLAFIESEHCPCLQSPTGPLGLFQFTQATGRAHGLSVRAGASPSNPDQRCEKEPAAKAAASYMKSLTARIGTGPLSIPLAIASYNSGEGGLGSNLKTALTKNESQERSFWTLVANKQILVEQFQKENIKYVPKFFGAAIIGENPKDFGIDMLPLSSYTK